MKLPRIMGKRTVTIPVVVATSATAAIVSGVVTYKNHKKIEKAMQKKGFDKITEIIKMHLPTIGAIAAAIGISTVSDKIAEVTQNTNPSTDENETCLFYDGLKNVYFESTIREINAVLDLLENKMDKEGAYSINDFYYMLSMPTIPDQNETMCTRKTHTPFSYSLCKMEDGLECYIINFPEPRTEPAQK